MTNKLKGSLLCGIWVCSSIFFISLSRNAFSERADLTPSEIKMMEKARKRLELDAHRTLSADEKKKLSYLVKTMEDKKLQMVPRSDAIRELGEKVAHIDALKPILRILEDVKEDEYIRYTALTAISQIADKSVVPILLRFLEDPSSAIRQRAHTQLRKLSGCNWYFSFMDDVPKEERAESVKKWREWWAKNEKTFVYKRICVLVETR